MKKLLLWVVTLLFALSTAGVAKKVESDKHKPTKEETQRKKEFAKQEKEKKALAEKAKKESRKREAAAKKAAAKAEKEAKKAAKKAEQEEKKAEKQKKVKVKKEKPAKEKKVKKEKPAKVKKAKKAHVKKEKKAKVGKEEKNAQKEAKKLEQQRREEEKNEKRELEKRLKQEKKQQQAKERKAQKKEKAAVNQERIEVKVQHKAEKKAEEKGWWAKRKEERREAIHSRKDMMDKWRVAHMRQVEADKKAGKYAYLYKQPTWPTSSLFYENKDLINIAVSANYASEAYVSSDMSSSHDITKLAFGDKTIKVRDILLASKLVEAGKALQDETIVYKLLDPTNIPTNKANEYLRYMADETLKFNGWTEQQQVAFGLSRYIWGQNFAIGFEIPVVYRKNHLELEIDLSKNATQPDKFSDGMYGMAIVPVTLYDKQEQGTDKGGKPEIVEAAPNAFLRRYGADPVKFIKDALLAKGMDEMGGSALGLGDVECFLNGRIKSILFDNMILGARVVFPTGKKATNSKLWAPDLGNGGFFEYGVFGSVMTSYKSYVNPHLMCQLNFRLPANIDRRIPRMITAAAETGPAVTGSLRTIDAIAFGDRVKKLPSIGFAEYDTTVKGFADKISKVKLTKGTEFKMRLGNIFENFISRAGTLDVYYDLRGKFKDQVKLLPDEKYTFALDTDMLNKDTQEVEHRFGINYAYQFDLYTRLGLGMTYVFAGKNVAKTIEGTASLNHSF